ncbi:hypothetical protein GXP67_03505 [Rhodocytophaga rosea]|uniref:Uncharacterized protein n=1 Tax=Rhodocytophaga rosea TaxID=2704465 RepID=A0A6C0GCW4_9BACT|nr:hypothetical protein [Rhodocytophaga rosea]QHT65795.1 hypothetical protein GXP67_03505 [Rhodocytophaga rosea]
MFEKMIKYLRVFNTLIVALFLLIILFVIIKYGDKIMANIIYSTDDLYATNYEDDIIVGEKLEQAKKDSLILQGLSYDAPQSIRNSTNKLVVISALTYEQARKVEETAGSAGDISFNFSIYNCLNIVFLDKDYKVIRRLLNKKGFISDYEIPSNHSRDDKPDTTVKLITYLIGFEDSNKDGVLNVSDHKDLYISDLSGGNLTKVTRNIDLVRYEFQNNYSKIFITYKDRSSEREEYKKEKYAIYTIATGKLQKLNELEKELAEIEKMLIN